MAARAAQGGVLAIALAGVLAAGCNPFAFNDLSDTTPILLLKKPDDLEAGFGVNLATASNEGQTHLLVGGTPNGSPAAVFDVGDVENPVIDAVGTGYCKFGDDPCFLAVQPAGLGLARLPGGTAQGQNLPLCFLLGIGSVSTIGGGIVGRCKDNTEYALAVPEDAVGNVIDDALSLGQSDHYVVIAADRRDTPAALVGVGDERMAWFYGPDRMDPVELIPPGSSPDASFGSSVAVVAVGQGRLFAVGAKEQGHVWLFRSEDGEKAERIGCLGGPPGFGRTLAAGLVDADTADDLVIADGAAVTVLSGDALYRLPAVDSTECSLASLPEGGLIASFGCGQTPSVSGCESSDFGYALEVGDLDGDGDGEVIVGAPGMTVRDEDRAGALLIYDAEGERPHALTEILFISSAEAEDQLGSAIATPRVAGRSVIAAGAPGGAKVAMFYCSKLLPADQRPSRCR